MADHVAPNHVGGFHVLTIASRPNRVVDAEVAEVHTIVRLPDATTTIRNWSEPMELLVSVEEVRGWQTSAILLAVGAAG